MSTKRSTVRWFAALGSTIFALGVAGRLAMPYAARRLIYVDSLSHADLIVVLGSFKLERTLEAGTLFREGWAPRVLLLRPPDLVDSGVLEGLRVAVPRWVEIQESVLLQMSVPPTSIEAASRTEDTTRREVAFVSGYAREHRLKRIIVVTSAYHTGRVRRLFRKARSETLDVVIRRDRYEHVDPDHWWRRPTDRYDVVLEYLKSLYSPIAPYVEDGREQGAE